MRFIDLYNKNKNTPVFRQRVKIFKTYCYLAKNNPKEFIVEWDKRNGCFNYLQKVMKSDNHGGSYLGWIVDENNKNYRCMGDFDKKNY
jgi:hypothetical protein